MRKRQHLRTMILAAEDDGCLNTNEIYNMLQRIGDAVGSMREGDVSTQDQACGRA